MKERNWISLVTSIRHGQCVLVLGPETSAEVRPNNADGNDINTTELLTSVLTEELEEDNLCVTKGTLAAVAQQYEDAQGFGSNTLRALTAQFYQTTEFLPSSIHSILTSLPFSIILTTCHDNLLSLALKSANKDPVVSRYNMRGNRLDNPEIALPYSIRTPLVYHLFGDAQTPNSLILSENDLLDFLTAIASERPALPTNLVRDLRSSGQSFLFVGFGIKHWYLRVLLKLLVRNLELDRSGTAIATESLHDLSASDRDNTVLFYLRGTRIEVEDTDSLKFLEELSERLQKNGGISDEAVTLGSYPRVFISYAHEDKNLAAKVFAGLQEAGFDPWFDTESLEGGDLWNERIQEELNTTDFTIVLYTSALCRKTDSYVNKEIYLARQRGLSVRGSFLIPLRSEDVPEKHSIQELSGYQEMPLRTNHFNDDFSDVITTLRRNYQRRKR